MSLEEVSRKAARELLKPLFDRPCSSEERVVTEAVEGYIRGLAREIDSLESQLSTLRTETIEMCAKVADEKYRSLRRAEKTLHELGNVRGAEKARAASEEAASVASSIRALSKTQET